AKTHALTGNPDRVVDFSWTQSGFRRAMRQRRAQMRQVSAVVMLRQIRAALDRRVQRLVYGTAWWVWSMLRTCSVQRVPFLPWL
ncbi:MAG TPA: hypothetical protein PKL17_20660, partial [Pseudomonadota bacterium]|nr:hypothetical protein [Pseudomonadota bacterium]